MNTDRNTPQQLRNTGMLHDTAPAYAYAYASACTRKEPLPRLEPVPLTRADWDYLLQERIGIMQESGLTLARAQALALGDTQRTHGDRPRGDA
jgi:hypothetical protein